PSPIPRKTGTLMRIFPFKGRIYAAYAQHIGIVLVLLWWHCCGRKRPRGCTEGGSMTLTNYLQKLDESSALPLYQQLQRALRTAIEKRVVGPDDALPPERDLADELSVSRITVRKAIDGLVDEGLLVRRQGA